MTVTVKRGTAEEKTGTVKKNEWNFNDEFVLVYIDGKPTKYSKTDVSIPF